MRKHNVTRIDHATKTRTTDMGATKGRALVEQVLNGFTYASPDVETAANETKRDWQKMIAAKVADLQADIGKLLEDINYYDDTYGAIPGDAPLMDHLLQAGQTLCDAAQDHDQVWIEDTYTQHRIESPQSGHQRYLDKMIMGREYHDFG